MLKKMLGTVTAIVAALALVGVAWAAGTDDSTAATIREDSTTKTSVDDSISATGATVESSTSATVTASSSASVVGDDQSDDDDGDVSSTTSTIASSTSTSIDDHGDEEEDDHFSTSTTFDHEDETRTILVPDGITTHTVPGVGSVTIEVSAGRLILVSISAPGWEVEQQHTASSRIEVEFTSGDAEAEFEARVDDGRVEVSIEVDSD